MIDGSSPPFAQTIQAIAGGEIPTAVSRGQRTSCECHYCAANQHCAQVRCLSSLSPISTGSHILTSCPRVAQAVASWTSIDPYP